MLTLYRRHTPDCTFFGKKRHAKGANACARRCPIWVQGTLRGEKIRRSLDLNSWQAASDLVRGWEASGAIGVVKPEVPTVKEAGAEFFAEAGGRGRLTATLGQEGKNLQKRAPPTGGE